MDSDDKTKENPVDGIGLAILEMYLLAFAPIIVLFFSLFGLLVWRAIRKGDMMPLALFVGLCLSTYFIVAALKVPH